MRHDDHGELVEQRPQAACRQFVGEHQHGFPAGRFIAVLQSGQYHHRPAEAPRLRARLHALARQHDGRHGAALLRLPDHAHPHCVRTPPQGLDIGQHFLVRGEILAPRRKSRCVIGDLRVGVILADFGALFICTLRIKLRLQRQGVQCGKRHQRC